MKRRRAIGALLVGLTLALWLGACDGGGSDEEEGPRGTSEMVVSEASGELINRTGRSFFTRYENPVTGVEGFTLVITTTSEDTLYLFAPRAKPAEGIYPVVPLEVERGSKAFMALGNLVLEAEVGVYSGTGELAVTEATSDSLFGRFASTLQVDGVEEDSLWQLDGAFAAPGSGETVVLPLSGM